jgi:hypothetical protein
MLDGSQQPGILDHVDDVGRERWRARIAGLHPVERAVEVGRQSRGIDLPLVQDGGELGVGAVEQAHQHVLDLDIVMASQRRQAGRALEGATADVVEASNQRFQLYCAHVYLVLPLGDHFSANGRSCQWRDYPAASVPSTREYSHAGSNRLPAASSRARRLRRGL